MSFLLLILLLLKKEDSSTEEFMDFLLRVDPNLDLYALIVDETQVNASLGGKQFSGIYNFESLTQLSMTILLKVRQNM